MGFRCLDGHPPIGPAAGEPAENHQCSRHPQSTRLGCKDSNKPKLYPGDIYVLVFDIEGLKADDSGLVKYGIGFELTDPKGKVPLREDPGDLEAIAALGPKLFAASAQCVTGTDIDAGIYTMKVTVVDRTPKPPVTTTLSRTFEVLPKDLGLTRLIVTYPAAKANDAILAPPIAVPGQGYIVNFAPVGFMLDQKTKQPNLTAAMRILDEKGEPVLKKAFTSPKIDNVGDAFKKIIPMQFILSLNRPGKFKLEIEVTDNLAKKSAKETLSFVVVEAK